MNYTLTIIQYTFSLFYGVFISAFFAGVQVNRKNVVKLLIESVLLGVIQLTFLFAFGIDITFDFYPIHTHLVMVIFMMRAFKISLPVSFLSVVWIYMCCQAPSYFSKLAGYIHNEQISDIVELVLYIIMVAIMAYLAIKYFSGAVNKLISDSKIGSLICSAVPVVYYIFDYITSVWTDLMYEGGFHVVQFMPTVISLVQIVVAVMLVREQDRRMNMMHQRDIVTGQLKIAESEFETLQQMQQQARIYRHDMRHHFAILLSLANEGRIDELKDYINENVSNLDNITPKHFCELEMLNLLLSHYYSLAENMKTKADFKIAVPEKLPLTSTELCSMVSNALENAMNALDDVEEASRILSVHLKEFNGKLVFSVENTYTGQITFENGMPVNHTEGHGFGTQSIAAIVKSHKGDVKFEAKENLFAVSAYIPT